MKKRGFTLLELIVVIIIVGILATLAVIQYSNIVEKGRRAEAASVLGSIRTQAIVYYNENGTYPDTTWVGTTLEIAAGGCTPVFYFDYAVDASTGDATATRCTGGGKVPDYTGTISPYTLTLSIDGSKLSDPAGLW